MGTVLERKLTSKDSSEEILKAIYLLATDKLGRVMLVEDNEWKQTKLDEIARLTRILKRKTLVKH